MHRSFFSIALITAATTIAAPVQASESPWEVRVVPYLWTAGVDGRLSHENFPISLHPSASFSDVFSRLDAAGMVVFEAHRERYGFFGDFVVVDLSDTVRIPLGGVHFPIEVSTSTTTALLAMQYRLRQDGRSHLDLVAGVRFWTLGTRFTYTVPSEIPDELPIPRQYGISQREWWPDIQVGLKGAHHFDNAFFVSGWALAGAGGADLTTDLMVSVGYEFGRRTSLLLGYRRIETDFSTSGGFAFDAVMHGPGVALEFRF
jgi:hypothetical protein